MYENELALINHTVHEWFTYFFSLDVFKLTVFKLTEQLPEREELQRLTLSVFPSILKRPDAVSVKMYECD